VASSVFDFSTAVQAEALWYVSAGVAELRTEVLPALQAKQIRVRTLFSALSRGTESLVFAGKVPEAEFTRMRAPFMGGDFPFPVKYGYASVGVVQSGPPELLNRRVFSLSPHQDYFNLPADAVMAIPDEVSPERAVLAANMETALNAVWDAAPGPGDRIAVVGGGVLGCLVAFLCGHLPGAEVTLVDINPQRAALAKQLGIKFATETEAPLDCDLVFHTSASAAGLTTALRLAGEEATVLELSWYGTQIVGTPLGGAFHSKQLRLQSSQVGHISATRRPRFTYRRRLGVALELLKDDRLDALLAPAIAFADLPEHLPQILGQPSGILCQLIQYS
jgi:NADPH:quinone reductase-like Zn-dependent oxidoreductase